MGKIRGAWRRRRRRKLRRNRAGRRRPPLLADLLRSWGARLGRNGGGRDRDYVRALEIEDSLEDKRREEIFADVLLGVLLHFVNATSAGDPLAKWVAEQESVLATETAETE